MDRLTSLMVFTQVVERGGFSAAARRLDMSTTMVSNHVQALEDRLGVRLLNRTTRRVSTTEIGRAYYDRCVNVLAELEDADQAAAALQMTPRGTLRMFAGVHVTRFIAPIVAQYLADYPEAGIQLAIGERQVDLIEEGFDLAISARPPRESNLIVRNLTPWRHILCCSPAYLEEHDCPREPADLAQHNCLRYALYPFGDEWRLTGPYGQAVAVKVSGNLVTDSAETLRAVALAGGGLFLAPSFIVADDLKQGRLVRLLEDYLPVPFAINAVYPHRHHLSAKVRCFIDLAVEKFAQQRNWLDPKVAG